MAWKTVTYESIDIRDGFIHELFLTGHELVKTAPRAGEKKAGEAHKFSGIEKGRGPVAFLATDSLAMDLRQSVLGKDDNKVGIAMTFPVLVRIQWKGKIAIKGGEQMFNVFACEQWLPNQAINESFPEWTTKSALEQAETPEMIKGEDLPVEGPWEREMGGPNFADGLTKAEPGSVKEHSLR